MPQEMRHPERRTESVVQEVEKLIILRNYLDIPSVQQRGAAFQDIVIQSIWPDMNILDAELIRDGLIYLDGLEAKNKESGLQLAEKEELPN